MKKTIMLAGLIISMFFFSYDAGAACLSEACYKRSIDNLFPAARTDIKSGKPAKPKTLASAVVKKSRTSYGFASGVSKEKGSFILGLLLMDLSVYTAAEDMDSTKTITGALVEGFKGLQAPSTLISSTAKVDEAVIAGANGKVMDMIIPVIEPFIYDYIGREGKEMYMRFGFWVETARLFLLQKDKDVAIDFLKSQMGALGAVYFNEALKNDDLPKGVKNSLKKIADLSFKENMGAGDVSAALMAITTIYELMI
jgi:hypothetical protein